MIPGKPTNMLTIHLDKLVFHAYHGIHEEEQVLGNEFEISAAIDLDTIGEITRLKHTLDYVTVYQLIRQRMAQPTPLLETVAQELTKAIHALDDRVKSVSIHIKKCAPPIKNFQGSVGVSYKIDF